jgi:ATP-binding cassette subfamily F protein 2
MVLVSHDMRLISQVAKEIWLCDNKTVTKYAGMQLSEEESLDVNGNKNRPCLLSRHVL